MPRKNNHITGILLAGGKSTRMGKDKGSVVTGEKQLFKYPLEILEAACDEILISTIIPNENFRQYEQVCDEFPGIGPLGGIHACLKRSRTEINFVISYDMPLVSSALFSDMLNFSNEYELVIPSLENRNPEPLCSIYRKNIIDRIEENISRGIYAVHRLFPIIKTYVFSIPADAEYYHPDLFMNINNPADLEYFERIRNKLGP